MTPEEQDKYFDQMQEILDELQNIRIKLEIPKDVFTKAIVESLIVAAIGQGFTRNDYVINIKSAWNHYEHLLKSNKLKVMDYGKKNSV